LQRSFGKFDLRFDSANTLNHVVFTNFNPIFGTTQFGVPTGANTMRSVAATLRWRF
jgi:hypothetical protein